MSTKEEVAQYLCSFTVINGGTYMSICNIIMVVCKKDNNMAGEIWRKTSDKQKEELQEFSLNFLFPCQGQLEQPVITLEGALKLIMWLPGNMAHRRRAAS